MNFKNAIYILQPLMMLIVVILGTYGFYSHALLHDYDRDIVNAFYRTLQLFVLKSGDVEDPIPLTLQIARFMAPAVIATGIVYLLWEWVNERHNLFRVYFFFRNHIVVCGLSDRAVMLIRNGLESGRWKKVVLIEKDPDKPLLDDMEKEGVTVIRGDAEDDVILKRAAVQHARDVLILADTDDTNINIARTAAVVYSKSKRKKTQQSLHIYIHIKDFYKLQIFKEHFSYDGVERSDIDIQYPSVNFHAFNIYRIAASRMTDMFCPDQYINIKSPSDPQVHIMIAGITEVGYYTLLETAQMYHFANLKKLKVTVADTNADQKIENLIKLYPFLGRVVEIDTLEESEIFNISEGVPEKLKDVSVCFVCNEDEGENLHTTYALRQLFYKLHSEKETPDSQNSDIIEVNNGLPQIVGMFFKKERMVSLIDGIIKKYREELNIHLYDLLKDICKPETIIDKRREEDRIAKQIHAYYKEHFDPNLKNWDKLEDFEKDKNRLPARHIAIKLRYLGAKAVPEEAPGTKFPYEEYIQTGKGTIENEYEEILARMEHARWVSEKRVSGYFKIKKRNNMRDSDILKDRLKFHPFLAEWDELSEEERKKDLVIVKCLPEVLGKAGMRVVDEGRKDVRT